MAEAIELACALMHHECLAPDTSLAAMRVLERFVCLLEQQQKGSNAPAAFGELLLPMIEAASVPLRLCVRAVHPDFQSDGACSLVLTTSTKSAHRLLPSDYLTPVALPPALLDESVALLLRLMRLLPPSTHTAGSSTGDADAAVAARSPVVARLLLHVVFLLRFAAEPLTAVALAHLPTLLRLLLPAPLASQKPNQAAEAIFAGCLSSLVSHITGYAASGRRAVAFFLNRISLLPSARLMGANELADSARLSALLRGAQLVAFLCPSATARLALVAANEQNEEAAGALTIESESLPASVLLLALCLRSASSYARAAACATVSALGALPSALRLADAESMCVFLLFALCAT